jgi:hypothetical protein
MSDKMLAMQEEEERFLKMQQQQDAVAGSGNTLSDLSIPPSPIETASHLPSPLHHDHPETSRETDISRRSQEVAKKLDRVVDTCNASFRTTPEMIKSLISSPTKLAAPGTLDETMTNSPAEIQEEQTLQLVWINSCLSDSPSLSPISPLACLVLLVDESSSHW